MKNTKKGIQFLNFRVIITLFSLFIISAMLMVYPAENSFAETKKQSPVTFNFVDVDLPVVTKFISDITGQNFIFDERVKGKITIIAPSKLSADDAYTLFTSVLELKGFTVMPSGIDAYKIVPAIEAKQRGMQISTEGMPLNESYIARLLSFKHISADEALKFLQPLISKDGHISIFGPANLLLIVDSGLNIEKVLSLIGLIDKPSVTDMPEVIPLKHSSADTVAKILNDGLGRGKTRPVPGQPAGIEGAMAVADQRLNAVILIGDRGVRESMKTLISLIDLPSPEAQGRINVYFLENADASELAKVLEGMIKGMQTSRQAAPGAPAQAVTPFESAGGITITPDKATNSLIILASPADYHNIVEVLRQLDKRRKQVFVEAMIIEASIDKLKEIGTKWRAIGRHNGDPVVIGGIGQMDSSALQSVITGLTGFTIGGMGNFLNIPITTIGTDGKANTSDLTVPGFSALFSLSEFRDAVNVLSTPQVLTSDNKEAEIVVGENVPFISKRERDLTTTNTVLNSIERKDVGITLRLTPQITEGDYVKLDIYQEISSLKQDSQEILINVGPTTTKRSTKTSVVVKDSQTVVIGGLMQEKEEENITKIPVLGDIPVLGFLFKQKSVSKNKTNLLVFLTPHVVKEAETINRITKEKQKEMAAVKRDYVAGELLVRFNDGVSEDAARAILSQKGATVIKVMDATKVYHIKLREGITIEDAIEEFKSLSEVLYAEPNYRLRTR
ncbi:MAG: type II secretion system secretin GspD [Nitrospirae bacterium]|nr:type II secretion system secretin GspD [Nitrospirota bacterium]